MGLGLLFCENEVVSDLLFVFFAAPSFKALLALFGLLIIVSEGGVSRSKLFLSGTKMT